MSYPGLGFLVVLGVAIGSAIYYYFNNEGNHHQYDYVHERQHRDGRGFRANLNDDNCSICLETLNNLRRVRMLSCGHTFHEHCITMWINQKRLCPICRVRV